MSEAAVVTGSTMSREEAARINQSKLGMWLFLGSEVMFFTGFLTAYIVLRTSTVIEDDQAHLNKWLAALNTLVLITSSLTMALGVRSIQQGNVGKMRQWIALTILCAFGFMGIKYVEYSAKLGITRSIALDDFSKVYESDYEAKGRVPVLAVAIDNVEDLEADEETYRTIHAGDTITSKIAGELEDAEVEEVVVRAPIDPAYSVFFAAYYTLTGFHGLHVLAGILVLLYILLRANHWNAKKYAFVECTGLYWHFVDVVWIFLFPALYLI